jgi:hypothetical protein
MAVDSLPPVAFVGITASFKDKFRAVVLVKNRLKRTNVNLMKQRRMSISRS